MHVVRRGRKAPILLVCDHASNAVPIALDRLGISQKSLQSHIAYDIGAARVAGRLSQILDAPLIFAGYSRLVIDLNRPLRNPESILEKSDGVIIPGNQNLNDAEKGRRINTIFRPYHKAVGRCLNNLWKSGRPPVLLSIHSFSPFFGKTPRPWDVGVLWNHDTRIALPLIELLEAKGATTSRILDEIRLTPSIYMRAPRDWLIA